MKDIFNKEKKELNLTQTLLALTAHTGKDNSQHFLEKGLVQKIVQQKINQIK